MTDLSSEQFGDRFFTITKNQYKEGGFLQLTKMQSSGNFSSNAPFCLVANHPVIFVMNMCDVI